MKLRHKTLALVISGLFVTTSFAQQVPQPEKKATDLGTISITGEGDKLGAGTIILEDGAKSRSTATRASIDKQRSTANPFQVIQQLPGVNTSSQDGTGLFGGALRVRGFNSDQMGFTVDGAPVNDSGSFSVFPQEYVDQENLEEVFVTQGSADNEAPHVGATGGNIGIVSASPLNKQRVRYQGTFGGLNLSKNYFRVDTGLLGDFKAYLSYSKAHASKFKGIGGANREHIDFKAMYNLGKGSSLQFTALWNNALNNNIRSLSLANIAAGGYFLDYATTFVPDPTGVNGTAQAVPTRADGYWTIPINPFRNAIITAKGWFAISPTLRVDIEPYFWYGFGNGNGGAPTVVTLREGTATTALGGGLRDLNGDGDLLDTVTMFRSSVTRTYRPGATLKLNWQMDNQRIVAGYWTERARHYQTQPANILGKDGTVPDYWLKEESLFVRRVDGTAYQGRDQRTISTATSFFVQDTVSLMNDQLTITPAIKFPQLKRDFTNFANDSTPFTYNRVKTEKSTNPSLGVRYNVTDAHQVFGNITKGSRTTSNFNLAATGATVTITNGVPVSAVLIFPSVDQETSVNMDIGYRFLSDTFTFSGSLYATDFKNRISRAYDEQLARTSDTNVGDATIRGFELEAGTAPVMGISLYSSLTYTKSTMKKDLVVSPTNIQPVSGKEFPDTPKWLAAVTLQYANGPFLASLANKYTGMRYTSLTNDQSIGGQTVVDLNMGYRLPDFGWIKSPTLRFNVSNLFDKRYLTLSSGSGSGYVTNTTGTAAGTVFFYVGSPRFSSLSLMADF